MNKAILTVAVGKRRSVYTAPELAGRKYGLFLNRFLFDYSKHVGPGVDIIRYDTIPDGCPDHSEKPYAFKAYALAEVIAMGYTTILWSDASTYPLKPMDKLWRKIEGEGYWFSNNRWRFGQWCSDLALKQFNVDREHALSIPETLGAAYGLDLRFKISREFAEGYIKWVKETNVICGPWDNKNNVASTDSRVLGHRHDQTIISYMTYTLKMQKSCQPKWYCDSGHLTQWDHTVLTNDYNRSGALTPHTYAHATVHGYCWRHKSLGCVVCPREDYENQLAGRTWQGKTPDRQGTHTIVHV